MENYDAILEEIFTSIHLITDRKLATLMLDRSVIVQVISRSDETKNLYRVSYQGVEYDAYSLKSDSFSPGEEVYMLVPDNNFSNKKILISRSAKIAEAIQTSSGGSSFAFGTISVSGQSAIVAEAASDILTLTAGSGITLTTNATTDTLTIAASAATPGDGTLSLAVAGIGLSGSATFKANQTTSTTFTVTSNATSSNTSSTIVSRDTNGSFAATTVSANLVGTASNATNLNNQSASYYLDYTNLTNKPTISDAIITVTSGAGLTGSGTFSLNQSTTSTITLSHSDTSNVPNLVAASRTYVSSLTFDTYGHVTALATASETVSAANNGLLTLAVSGIGLAGSATFSADQSGNSTFTVTSNATSSNVTATIVSRDTLGAINISTAYASTGSATTPSFSSITDTNTGIFFPVADTLAFAEGGVEVMRIDSSARVGIGTQTPTQRLDVVGTISGTGLSVGTGSVTAPSISPVDDSNTGIFFPAADTIAFVEGGVEAMRIDSSGRVGIGNTPSVSLDVTGEIAIRGGELADDARMYFRASDNSNRFTIETDFDTLGTNDLLGFRSVASDNILVLRGNGDVGIGVTTPSSKLQVNGVVSATSFISTISTGTAPLTVSSTTLVTNLNSDLLDGQHGSFYQNAGNLNAGTLLGARLSTTSAYSILTTTPKNNTLRVNLGNPSVNELSLEGSQATNKTIFFPLNKVTYEYTIDGSTWSSWTLTDTVQRNLFTGLYLGGNGAVITNGWIAARMTLESVSYVYLDYLYYYSSTQGHQMYNTIEASVDGTTWTTIVSNSGNGSSWPGHFFLPHSTIPWHPTPTPGSHYKFVRLTFTPTWNGSFPSNDIRIYNLNWFGGYPADKREIYTWNYDKEISFPAAIRTIGGSATTPSIAFSSDTNTGIYSPVADTLAFVRGGTEAVRINSSGNVGIGTQTPTTRLDVIGTISGSALSIGTGSTITPSIAAFNDSNTGIFFPAADTIALGEGGTEVLRINSSANVGIGTQTPSSKLDVVGTISATSFVSTVATGAAPFTVSSTTLVTNLNADLLDGQHGTYYLDYTNLTNKPTISDAIITIASGTGLTGSGTFSLNQTATARITVSHDDTSNVSNVATASGVFVSGLTFDTYGHVTGVNTASGGGNSFGTISVSGQSALVASSSNDILTVAAGTNITLSTDSLTKTLTINASSGGTAASAFGIISIVGQDTVSADSPGDTLTFGVGNGIILTSSASIDSVTIATNGTSSNTGSTLVFRDTSGNFAATNIAADLNGTASNSIALNGQTASFYLNYNNLTNKPTISDSIITIASGNGLTGSGTFSLNQSTTGLITVSHNDTSNVSDVGTASGVFINGLTFDTFGHVLSVNTSSVLPSSNAFARISVSGQSLVVADTTESILTLTAGTASIITTNATTDTVTFAVDIPAIRVTGFTSTGTASWASTTAGGFTVKKDIAIAGVTASDYPEVAFNLSTYAVAQNALLTYVETYAGGITLYGVSTPSSTVSFDYVILKG